MQSLVELHLKLLSSKCIVNMTHITLLTLCVYQEMRITPYEKESFKLR